MNAHAAHENGIDDFHVALRCCAIPGRIMSTYQVRHTKSSSTCGAETVRWTFDTPTS